MKNLWIAIGIVAAGLVLALICYSTSASDNSAGPNATHPECAWCNGTGYYWDYDVLKTCPHCHGTGKLS